MKAKYIPNILSVIRIIMAFAFAAVFIWLPDKLYIAVIIFVAGGVTDVVDGILARRFGWITDAGKILDPLADKLIEVAALVLLAIRWGQSFVALAIIALLKEVLMIIGAYVIVAKAKVYVMSMWFGKLTTFLLYVEVLVVSFLSGVISSTVCDIMSIVVIVSMLITFVMYYISYRKSIKIAVGNENVQRKG